MHSLCVCVCVCVCACVRAFVRGCVRVCVCETCDSSEHQIKERPKWRTMMNGAAAAVTKATLCDVCCQGTLQQNNSTRGSWMMLCSN